MAGTISQWFSLGLLLTQSLLVVWGQGTPSIMPSSTIPAMTSVDSGMKDSNTASAASSHSLPILQASSQLQLSTMKNMESTDVVTQPTANTMALSALATDLPTSNMSKSIDFGNMSNTVDIGASTPTLDQGNITSSTIAVSASIPVMSAASNDSSVFVIAISTDVVPSMSATHVISEVPSISAQQTEIVASLTALPSISSAVLETSPVVSIVPTSSSISQAVTSSAMSQAVSSSVTDAIQSSNVVMPSSNVVMPSTHTPVSSSMVMSSSDVVASSSAILNGTQTKPDNDAKEGGVSSSGGTVIAIIVILCVVMLIIGAVVIYKRQNFTPRSLRAFLTSSVKYKTYSNASYKDEEVADLGFYN